MVDIQSLWSGLDTALILLYFAGIIAVGILMRGKAGKSMKSFFVASRRLTIPILIGVGAASWEDSWSDSRCGRMRNDNGCMYPVLYLIPTTIMKLPLALWIGPRVKEKFPDWVVTMPDLMSYLYDNKTKLVVALGILPQMFYDSALFSSWRTGNRVCYRHKHVAVVRTSRTYMYRLHFAFRFMGTCTHRHDTVRYHDCCSTVTLCLGIYNYYGGFGPLFSQAAAVNPDFVTISGGNNAMEIAAWLVSAVAIYANAQSYQRFESARSAADLKVAYSFIILFGQFFMSINVFAGMAALTMFPELAAESPAEAFWAVVFTTLPIGLRGLFVASLLAAVMSTVSADYLVGGAAISHDIVKGFINKNMTDKGDLMGTRIAVWAIGVAMIFCTYFWEGGIQKAWYYVGGFSVAAFIVPMLFGLYYKRRTPAGGFWSMTLTIVMYMVWEFILECPYDIPSSLICFAFNTVVYLIVCNATYGRYSKSKAKLDAGV